MVSSNKASAQKQDKTVLPVHCRTVWHKGTADTHTHTVDGRSFPHSLACFALLEEIVEGRCFTQTHGAEHTERRRERKTQWEGREGGGGRRRLSY